MQTPPWWAFPYRRGSLTPFFYFLLCGTRSVYLDLAHKQQPTDSAAGFSRESTAVPPEYVKAVPGQHVADGTASASALEHVKAVPGQHVADETASASALETAGHVRDGTGDLFSRASTESGTMDVGRCSSWSRPTSLIAQEGSRVSSAVSLVSLSPSLAPGLSRGVSTQSSASIASLVRTTGSRSGLGLSLQTRSASGHSVSSTRVSSPLGHSGHGSSKGGHLGPVIQSSMV